MNSSFKFVSFFILVVILSACREKMHQIKSKPELLAFSASASTATASQKDNGLVGVYFMPSWNTSSDPNVDRDSFWSCLQDPANCSSLLNPGIWGPKGRIYNKQYPYEGPYLDRKPIKELKGFYKRTDAEVAKKQLQYMKSYGIDFFAYNWFFGRHYFHHLNFAPQSKIYYPKDWQNNPNQSGRVAVPGLIEWGDQLEVLLAENAKLPKEQQITLWIRTIAPMLICGKPIGYIGINGVNNLLQIQTSNIRSR